MTDVPESGDGEFEVKLSGPQADVEQAFATVALDAGAQGAGKPLPTRRLSAIYFDTADRRLARQRAALRVRREGDRYVQALKIDRGPIDRFEHEAETRGMVPELDLLPDAVRPQFGALYPEDLMPVFATDVGRRKRDVVRDDGLGLISRVELALDEGHLRADERIEPLLEIEVEHKGGDRALVFQVCQDLVEAGASRIITRSKAARGYALADGTAAVASRAGKLELGGSASVGEGMGLIWRAVFAQWWANHDAAFDGGDAEGVHQLRVALRRLRSALTLFGEVLSPDRRAWLAGEARWVMGVLGDARDLDVFALEMLPPIAASRPNDAALAQLRSATEDVREGARATLRDAMASKRYARFLLGFGQWVAAQGWYNDADPRRRGELGAPIEGFAVRVLDKRARAVRKRGRGFGRLDVEQRHEVRKSLKKLRYATDYFRGLFRRKDTKRYLARLARLQDAFGHMNDMAMVEGVLARVADPGEPRLAEARGIVLGYYAHVGLEAEAELRADWQGFAVTEPFWARAGAC